jgi:nicotinamidase-related amidase
MIDVINDFNFPEAEDLFRFAVPMSKNLKRLAARARNASVPAIYKRQLQKMAFRLSLDVKALHERSRQRSCQKPPPRKERLSPAQAQVVGLLFDIFGHAA